MTKERYYYIDRLRVIAMAVVFIFHCTRYFDTDGWHIKNNATYTRATLVPGLIVQWLMPLLFPVSCHNHATINEELHGSGTS